MAKAKAAPTGEVPIETVAIDDLHPHPRNYNHHPDDQIAHIQASITKHGLYRNVVIARDGTILAGHGVVEAARRMGVKEMAVRRLDIDPDDVRAIEVLTADNEIPHLGERDDRQLSELLKNIWDSEKSLMGTGYDEMMLAGLALVTRPETEIRNHDAAAEWVGLPGFEPAGERTQLMLAFDTVEERDALIAQLGLRIAKKTRGTWSAWWPPRELEDLTSLRFVESDEPVNGKSVEEIVTEAGA